MLHGGKLMKKSSFTVAAIKKAKEDDKDIKKNVLAVDKFDIVCLVGPHKLIYL